MEESRLWKEEFLLQIYEYARAGLSKKRIAEGIGVSWQTFKKFMTRPAVEAAIKRGRSQLETAKTDSGETFLEYVYKQLDPKLQECWDKIERWEDEENGIRKIELMLSEKGLRVRQNLFVHALVDSNFNLSEACRRVNVTKGQFDSWVDGDPDFLKLVEEVEWHKKNFFEAGLVALVKGGDSAATIFANRTRNRDRGYDPKITVTIDGNVNHRHDITSLNLPLEVRKALLEAIRAKKMEALPAPISEPHPFLDDKEPVINVPFDDSKRD